ncbi:hypothetical protein BX666DRAFT_469434 [Dichotomocladium elegans]|nr:hypothetical protein BX666DRAFT_469434 [Dichotomocladium elegans]
MNGTCHLQADTKAAMTEWMNVLQKAIFKSKNHGNSLKIALPFESILDIELTEAFEFQQFLQIRAVGIDDSFVMDEYYFAYFHDARITYKSLKAVWDVSQQQHLARPEEDDDHSEYHSMSGSASPTYSLSDMYDGSQPITIPALKSLSSVATVATGPVRSTPSPVLRGPDPSAADVSDSSSSEDDVMDWLNGKRRSGLKLVYGLLGTGGGSNTSSAATVHRLTSDVDGGASAKHQQCSPVTSRSPPPLVRTDSRESVAFRNEGLIDDRTQANFRKYFVLPESDKLHAVYRCSLMKTLPCYGKLYISDNHVSFNSKGFATQAKVMTKESQEATKKKIS